jgi:hypothetical protein
MITTTEPVPQDLAHSWQLMNHLEAIERAFGEPLDWQPLPDRIACRVKTVLSDTIWQDIDDRPRQYEWLKFTLHKLTDAIQPFIGELDANPATQSAERKEQTS